MPLEKGRGKVGFRKRKPPPKPRRKPPPSPAVSGERAKTRAAPSPPLRRKTVDRPRRQQKTERTRDERELQRLGFVRAAARARKRQDQKVARTAAASYRLAPRATAAPKGLKPPTAKQIEAGRRAALEAKLARTGVFDIAEQASRIYGDRSAQGKALSLLVGPAGEPDPTEKTILAASAFPLFRPIRSAKAVVAGAGALRAGLGRKGARAAAEVAYKTPTLAKGARKAAGKVTRVGAGAAPRVAARRVGKTETDPASAQRRLDKLDKMYEKRVAETVPIVNPFDPKATKVETVARNLRRGRLKGGVRHGDLPTVKQEVRKLAEDALDAFAAKHPKHPVAQMIRERETLRAQINARAVAQFEGTSPPKLELPGALAGEPPPATRVREALGPARARRAAQEGLYREERGKRIAASQAAVEAAGGGTEGFRAGMRELRGELPKVQFQHLREGNLSQGELDQLFRNVQNHPELRPFQKIQAQRGLLDAFEHGRVPQKSQIKLLSTVFGQDAADEIAKISRARRLGEFTIESLNVPRSLMASFDLSAPFRQGLVAGAGHPRIFARNFAPMIRVARSEKAYRGIMDEIGERANADLYHESGLKLTDLGDLSTREEQFASNIAEKLPPVRASARGYVGFLNKMRADVFDHLIETARAEGVNVEDKSFLRGIAKYVNSSTGRGSLGRAEEWAPALNALFFSPRLMASRINFLDPTWYMRLDPFARKQALRSMLRLAGAASVVVGLGAAAGAKVATDPRNADFAKLRIGNTRIDLLGGFQQYVRLVAQITSGRIVSSTTGETMRLGAGLGELSRKDIAERFLVSKFAPPPSFVYDFFKGTDFAGEPFEVKKALLRRLLPFIAQDVADLYRETGSIAGAVGGAGLIGVGVGVQTYAGERRAQERIKERHDDYGKLVEEGIRKTKLGKGLTPQLTKALEVRQARYQNREKMGADDARERFEADVRFLERRKVLDKAKADKAVAWVQHEERDYFVERELRRLSDWYFDDLYGDALADAREKLRDRGVDLPRAPR